MENMDSAAAEWIKNIPTDFVKNWKINTPDGEKTVAEYFRSQTERSMNAMKETDEYKRLNLYEDLITKFPLSDIRKKRESNEALTFLEWVVVHHHYKTAASAMEKVACDREGLSAMAMELSTIANNAKSNAFLIPLDVINKQIAEVIPYMSKQGI